MVNLRDESLKVRHMIEEKITEDLPLFIDSFPINACKQASLLFCYHLERLGFNKPLKCVFGISKKRIDDVGHWWIETEGKIIDLTADQFNIIEDRDLSYKIKAKRPYNSVYCCPINKAPHYKVFNLYEAFKYDLNELATDFIDDLVRTYELLLSCKSVVTPSLTQLETIPDF